MRGIRRSNYTSTRGRSWIYWKFWWAILTGPAKINASEGKFWGFLGSISLFGHQKKKIHCFIIN